MQKGTFTAFFVSLMIIVLLAVIWHVCGWAGRSIHGYPITSFFTGCSGVGFSLAYVIASWLLGRTFRHAGAVALGMLTPLPIGLIYEVVKDPTSHNLFPFEIVLLWLPAFAISFCSGIIGARLHWPTRPMPKMM